MEPQQNSEIEVCVNNERQYLTKSNNIICIGCGAGDLSIYPRYTSKGNIYFFIECNKCGLKTIRTHCFECGRQKLYKNGPWWTYHMTKATQVSNVVCPSCGAYFS